MKRVFEMFENVQVISDITVWKNVLITGKIRLHDPSQNPYLSHVRPAALHKTDSKERAGTYATRIIRMKGKGERGRK